MDERDEKKLDELYGELCDVWEQAHHGDGTIDLDPERIRLTSSDARAAASRCFDVLGIGGSAD